MTADRRTLILRVGRLLATRHPAVLAAVAIALAVGGLLGLLLLAVVAGATPARGDHSTGVDGIDQVVLDAYVAAERLAGTIVDGCAVRWQILAAIGKVESGHATHSGATVHADGTVEPPIIGIALDGSRGTARVADTDGGRWDGDDAWDRAVGPMQFIPSSWRRFGRDGNGDGVPDPHNVYDAALGAAAHLCGTRPGDYTDREQLASALQAYNRSHAYVTAVLAWVDQYDGLAGAGPGPVAPGGYALPVDRQLVPLLALRRPHHTYPAWDLALPVGTPFHAAHAGQVVAVPGPSSRCGLGALVDGDDGYRYVYCHASAVAVRVGDHVTAGQLLGRSGSTGNSTGPHLHFGIRDRAGRNLCPQELLVAWHAGIPLTPVAAPARGCTY